MNKQTLKLTAVSFFLSSSLIGLQAFSQAKYSSEMSVTIGEDSNIFPDKAGVGGAFFEAAPQIKFETQNWTGSLKASIKDYSKQELSTQAQQNQISTNLGYNINLTNITKSTTELSFKYSDEKWPDWIDGTENGMPMRYFQTVISQGLDWNINQVGLGIKAHYNNTDYTSNYTDWAPEVFGQQFFEIDYEDYGIEGKVSFKLNENLELVGKPKVSQRKFKDRPARQTDGSQGGEAFRDNTGNLNIITNEFNLEVKINLGNVSITPTLKAGTRADQVFGAEDSSLIGGGLSAKIVLDEPSKFDINTSFSSERRDFDNWTNRVPDGETRLDNTVKFAVNSGINFTETFRAGLSYSNEQVKSNFSVTDVNYRQEVIGTTLTLSF